MRKYFPLYIPAHAIYEMLALQANQHPRRQPVKLMWLKKWRAELIHSESNSYRQPNAECIKEGQWKDIQTLPDSGSSS